MSLSKFINNSEIGNEMETFLQPMDISEVSSASEVLVKTKKVKKSKNPNPKWYRYLLLCLDDERHNHMLKYVPGSNNKEFEVTFIDKKNKKNWRKKDISLFIDLDNHIKKAFNRERPSKNLDEQVKTRFKSNMSRTITNGFVKQIGKEKIERYKTLKRYEILRRLDGVQNNNEKKNGKIKGKKNYKKNENKEANVQVSNFGNIPPGANHEINLKEYSQINNNESVLQIANLINYENESGNMNFNIISEMNHDENKMYEILPKDDVFDNEKVESVPVNLPQDRENKIYYQNVNQEHNDIAVYSFQEDHRDDSHYLCLLTNSQIESLERDQNISNGKYIMDDICLEGTNCITPLWNPIFFNEAHDPNFGDLGAYDEWPSVYQLLENMEI